jgi:hypothetical protein
LGPAASDAAGIVEVVVVVVVENSKVPPPLPPRGRRKECVAILLLLLKLLDALKENCDENARLCVFDDTINKAVAAKWFRSDGIPKAKTMDKKATWTTKRFVSCE